MSKPYRKQSSKEEKLIDGDIEVSFIKDNRDDEPPRTEFAIQKAGERMYLTPNEVNSIIDMLQRLSPTKSKEYDRIDAALEQAISALHLADSSDYESALRGVVKELEPMMLRKLRGNSTEAYQEIQDRVN